MHIYIPSAFRPDYRLGRGVLAQLPEDIVPRLVVPRDEFVDYHCIVRDLGLRARIIPHTEVGLPMTKRWIAQYALSQGERSFCMMDDDIWLLVRRAEDTWRLRNAEHDDVRQMVEWMSRKIDEVEYASISLREGNNHHGIGSVDDLVAPYGRSCRVHCYRTDQFLALEHGRCELHEDFDCNLQILESGGTMAISGWFAQGQRMMNEPGGCATYRTHERQEASARRLAELHPGIVSLRTTRNKTDAEGMGTRVEPTIQWKLAWERGQRLRSAA